MKLRVSNVYACLYGSIQRFRARLPGWIWRYYHRPIGRRFREESMLESIAPHCSQKAYPPTYRIDPKLNHQTTGVSLLSTDDGFRSEIIKVRNALVLNDGLVLCGGSVHRGSVLYGRITTEKLFRASAQAFDGRARAALTRATLISTQIVDQGSYGDFVLEFSLPLAANREHVEGPLLIERGYISSYCDEDLKALLMEKYSIPENGVLVDELTIVGPCQIYDNFTRHNVLAIRSAFPVAPAKTARNVYISRAGYRQVSDKTARHIKNEVEVEDYLRNKGFEIFRAHEAPNKLVREAVASANIVIGSHGSGLFHLLWGNPRAIIEVASEGWWGASCYKFSQVLQTPSYQVLATDDEVISLEKLDSMLMGLDLTRDLLPVSAEFT